MEMVEVPVSQLDREALGWAVAQAVGEQVMIVRNREVVFDTHGQSRLQVFHEVRHVVGEFKLERYMPWLLWGQGGPLTDQYEVAVLKQKGYFSAVAWKKGGGSGDGDAKTRLSAAMKAIVAAEIGQTASIPKELVNAAH